MTNGEDMSKEQSNLATLREAGPTPTLELGQKLKSFSVECKHGGIVAGVDDHYVTIASRGLEMTLWKDEVQRAALAASGTEAAPSERSIAICKAVLRKIHEWRQIGSDPDVLLESRNLHAELADEMEQVFDSTGPAQAAASPEAASPCTCKSMEGPATCPSHGEPLYRQPAQAAPGENFDSDQTARVIQGHLSLSESDTALVKGYLHRAFVAGTQAAASQGDGREAITAEVELGATDTLVGRRQPGDTRTTFQRVADEISRLRELVRQSAAPSGGEAASMIAALLTDEQRRLIGGWWNRIASAAHHADLQNQEQWKAIEAIAYALFRYLPSVEAALHPQRELLSYTIEDYSNAPSGIGPLADEWKDKPHRLVYDLCAWITAPATLTCRNDRCGRKYDIRNPGTTRDFCSGSCYNFYHPEPTERESEQPEQALREALDGWIEAHQRLDHSGITDCTRCKRIAELRSGFKLAALSPQTDSQEPR